MLPTPSTSHVNYNHVYEPAEDSHLLLDTLSSTTETAFLRTQFAEDSATPVVLEVGTGSGVVLAFVTANVGHIFGRSDVATLGLDVNHFACAATKETVLLAVKDVETDPLITGTFMDSLAADLTASLKPRSIDVLIFNPPYVPTEGVPQRYDEVDRADRNDVFTRDHQLLSLSTDGGIDGMEVTERLLAQLPEVLSDRGVAYILLSAQNRPEDVMSRIRSWRPRDGRVWSAVKVGSSGRKAGWERLCVIRIWRSEPE